MSDRSGKGEDCLNFFKIFFSCAQANGAATAAVHAAPPAELRPSLAAGRADLRASPPAHPPRGHCPRRGPRPAHLRLRGFPRKKTPLPAVLPVPPAAPLSPRGAGRGGPADAAPAAAPSAETARRPPAPAAPRGEPRAGSAPAGVASRRQAARPAAPPLRLRVLRAAAVSAGERRITKASLRAAAAAAAAQAAVTSGNNAAASPPARRPLKAHGALPGVPAAGPGMAERGCLCWAPALQPPGRRRVPLALAARTGSGGDSVCHGSLPPSRAVPRAASAALIAAFSCPEDTAAAGAGALGPRRAGPQLPAAVRGRAASGPTALAARTSPMNRPGSAFAKAPAPRGPGPERFQPVRLLLPQ